MLRRDLLAATALAALVTPMTVVADDRPTMSVYKSPWCGCCGDWVDHIRAAGFRVEVHEVDDVMPMKRLAGVPDRLASCHTASIDGYVVEGHVPADIITRFLAERPAVTGLAVPGMPIGSPGMAGPNPEPYAVHTFAGGAPKDVYARVTP